MIRIVVYQDPWPAWLRRLKEKDGSLELNLLLWLGRSYGRHQRSLLDLLRHWSIRMIDSVMLLSDMTDVVIVVGEEAALLTVHYMSAVCVIVLSNDSQAQFRMASSALAALRPASYSHDRRDI